MLSMRVKSLEKKFFYSRENKIVWSNKEHCTINKKNDFVDVNAEPQQTIFAINTNKTCETNSSTNYSFVRYTIIIILEDFKSFNVKHQVG